MAAIKLLDRNIQELIAAGEVVERPASVVKELMENAIDAGAASVEVELRRGGLELIRVSDDGCGIPQSEVPTAFLRHATSKIQNEADLNAIATLGFRGEALAAICAVSRVTLVTSTGEGDATRYIIEGGEQKDLTETGAPKGTTIFVRDLFYNTPARMKFLKKDVHEGNAVQTLAEQLALSHPEVAIRFIREGRTVFSTPGDGKLYSALFSVLPRAVADNMIPLREERGLVTVTGYITTPDAARQSRSMQSLFVNGRFVRSRSISASAEEGCRGLVMAGKHPAFAICIELPHEEVDINVHPAKTEVRFQNEREVTGAVYAAVKLTLGSFAQNIANRLEGAVSGSVPAAPTEVELDSVRAASGGTDPTAVTDSNQPPETASEIPGTPRPVSTDSAMSFADNNVVEDFLLYTPRDDRAARAQAVQVSDGSNSRFLDIEVDYPTRPRRTMGSLFPDEYNDGGTTSTASAVESQQDPVISTEAKPDAAGSVFSLPLTAGNGAPVLADVRLVGELFATYIVLEAGDSVVFVDKHAAHERLLYDRFVANGAGSHRQLLLTPVVVPLSREELQAVDDYTDVFAKLGFVVEPFGEREAVVREIPTYFSGKAVKEAVEQMADGLVSLANDVTPDETEWLLHSCACRAAIKAGARTTDRELVQLVRDILSGNNAKHCPHGRPVCIEIKKKELEKRFGRIQ